MPSTQKTSPRVSEVEAQPDSAQKGRSELSRDEMRAAQFTPESEGPGLDHAPDAQDARGTRTQEGARFDSPDAAPNERVAQDAEEDGRMQRSST